ncbi:MAG TPA: copper resistance protein CopC [Vineibacter sp.]|nr:copper resistance protein CopC [Vineibacter sp.]
MMLDRLAVLGMTVGPWRRRIAAMITLAMLVLTAAAGDALAHAALLRTEPADGAVVAEAPTRFSLTFNEPVSPLVLKLVRPDGSTLDLQKPSQDGATLAVEAPGDIASGTHVLSWRVVSEDGHPVAGAVVFSVRTQSAVARPVATPLHRDPVRGAVWIIKLTLLASLFFGVGGTFCRAWIAPGSRYGLRFVVRMIGLGLIAAPLSVGLQGIDALDGTLSGVAMPETWIAGLNTSYGRTVIVAAVALLLALATVRLVSPLYTRGLSLLALVCVGVALASSGHAGAAHPQWLTRPAVFLHTIAIGFWIGALVPLAMQLTARAPEAVDTLHRFSRAIPIALVPLVASGLTLAVIQLEQPSSLWTTAYGNVLLIKGGLLVILLGVAAVNRWRWTSAVDQGEPNAARRLARAILVETVLVLGILGMVSLWRFTPPPRALASAAQAPAYVHIHTAAAMADITVMPGRTGPVMVVVTTIAGDFTPLEAKEVTLALANPDAGIEPIRRAAHKRDDGTWMVDNLVLPTPGRWSVRADILVSDFEQVTLEDTIVIRP